MNKRFLVEQLLAQVRGLSDTAARAAADAAHDAQSGAQRAVNLAAGHVRRAESSLEALRAIEAFQPPAFARTQPVGLGALVEIESDEGEGRTLFLAPAGGGAELTGPDGDGVFQVATPASPVGRAVMGKRVGAVVEVPRGRDTLEWTITWVG